MEFDICIATRQTNLVPSFIPKFMINNTNLIIETSKPLAIARFKAIQQVKTKWFAFIDDDVQIDNTWLDTLMPFISSDVGAIQGVLKSKGLGRFDKHLYKYKRLTSLKVGERGCTHNTLIRTELIKDWCPSFPDPSGYEDFEISQHILKKGYKWLIVPTKSSHTYSWKKIRKNAVWNMRGWKKSQKPNISQTIKKIIRLMIAPLIQKDIYVVIYTLYQNFFHILGILF